tara:strand:- start:273 stop:902 length:630 start_codon:yes stop_codon:yes gene_type:complete
MKINNSYWYFKGVLSKKFCEELIQYGKQKEDQLALTGSFKNLKELSKKQLKDLKKKRNSNIVWIGEQWVYKEILPYVHLANKNAGWNFDWNYSEDCQFTKYTEGQFYDWHQDSFDGVYDKPDNINLHNKIRKLSVTCSLSNPDTYKGGELEFYEGNPERINKKNMLKCTEISEQGSIVIFPSFMWHRVCQITKGTRYSLVIWNCGNEFK